MREVEFVDTSVLLNILDVPGKNQDRQRVVGELGEKDARGVQLIIPVSAVIETGNHITNLPDGHSRRICAQRFEKVLGAVARGELPWALHQLDWGDRFLEKLCVGVVGTGSFVDCCHAGPGLRRPRHSGRAGALPRAVRVQPGARVDP